MVCAVGNLFNNLRLQCTKASGVRCTKENLSSNPRCIYLGESPIEVNGAYIQGGVYRIVMLQKDARPPLLPKIRGKSA